MDTHIMRNDILTAALYKLGSDSNEDGLKLNKNLIPLTLILSHFTNATSRCKIDASFIQVFEKAVPKSVVKPSKKVVTATLENYKCNENQRIKACIEIIKSIETRNQ